jgi:peptide/nickel transport system permease protein
VTSRRALVTAAAILALIALPRLGWLDPYRVDLDALLRPPALAHPLGTDQAGRDALARLIVGAGGTLGVGLLGATLAVAIGIVLGSAAGLAGSRVDAVVMRAVDGMLAFPTLFVILIAAAVFPPGPGPLVLVLGFTGWMEVARLTRARVLEGLRAPFVEAARAIGATPARVAVRHLVPYSASVLAVAWLVQFSRAILAEATVSFLGFGIAPPTPTWGNLLVGAQHYVYTAPWLAIAPGVAITVTLLWLHTVGGDLAAGSPRRAGEFRPRPMGRIPGNMF